MSDKKAEALAELLETITASARQARDAPSNAKEHYARITLMLAYAYAAVEHGQVGMLEIDKKG